MSRNGERKERRGYSTPAFWLNSFAYLRTGDPLPEAWRKHETAAALTGH